MKPLVSILTTAYNRENYVGECIESVLRSEFEDFELLIVDDCSSDNTYETAKQYEERDSRVRVSRNDKNLGDYPNRNFAASLARGKYIKYLDSDDIIYPHGLKVMVGIMEMHPTAALGLSAFSFEHTPHPVLLKPQQSYRRNFFEVDLFGRAPGSTIIRREEFSSVGGFSGISQVGDHELWLRLAGKYPVVTLPRDLVWDRTHGDQEKFLDSESKKLLMHHAVQVSALRSMECPLDETDKRLAQGKMRMHIYRRLWSLCKKMKFGEAISLGKSFGQLLFDG